MKRSKTQIASTIGLLTIACASSARQDKTVEDEDIVVTSYTAMSYPRMAQVSHILGMVVVRVELDDAGKVVSSTAVSGSRVLIPDSLANAKKWRFQPNAKKNAVIIYDFRLAEGMCDPNESESQNRIFVFRKPNIASITACPSSVQP